MLGKKYSLGSTTEQGEARIKLANFDELRSQGDDIAAFLNTFSPDPNFVYLHVIAMGAGEYYGCNINGDYFPEKDLINRHHTFVTTAKVFKEHDNKPYSPDYGHVAHSWYNPRMHRVELILAVDKVKGKEFIDRQERGEQLEVSMGCKVLYDVCSICGNKAKKASDYCTHIRYDKKKIYPDGKQPYMINYNPTFFDISIVRRRADRIAYVLDKVASADHVDMMGEIAEDYLDDVSNIPIVEEPKTFDIEDEYLEFGTCDNEKVASVFDTYEKIAMIKKLTSDAVKVLNVGAENSIPLLEKVEQDIPYSILHRLASNNSFEDILKSFAASGIPMKPTEATRIIIIQRGFPESAADDVLSGIMSAGPLPTIDRGEVKDSILSMLEPFLLSRSSHLPAISYRLKNIVPMLEKRSFTTDVAQAYYNGNPNLSFGMVRNPEPFTDVRGVAMPQAYYVHQAEVNSRPKLKDPTLSPVEAGLVAGALYAAYKERGALWDLIKRDPKMAAAMAVIAAGLSAMCHKEMHTKTASVRGLVLKGILPFVGAHFVSAHYRNKYNHGGQLNGIEKFIAENPDILSIAAPLAVNTALRKTANVIVSDDSDIVDVEDTTPLTDSAISGIIFHSDRHSALSGAIDGFIESPILSAAGDAAGSLYKSHVKPIGNRVIRYF